jgi:DNA polymerase zeta
MCVWHEGRMPMAELADAIVQCARSTLEWSINLVRSHPTWNAEVVYGDTDSMFVHLRGRSREEAHRIGDEIAHEITRLSPVDVVLKMEKVFLPCILASKKRYVGLAYESLSTKTAHFDAKGIEVVRRDQCPCTSKLQEKALRILFSTKDLSAVKAYLYDQWTRMHEGGNRLPLRDFIFRREVRLGKYKGTNQDALSTGFERGQGEGDGGDAQAEEIASHRMLPSGAVVACKLMAKDPRAEPPYRWRVPYVVT